MNNRNTQQDVFNVMGALYAAVIFLGVNNASSVQPVVAVERSVFYRERAAGMYAPLSYAIAQVGIQEDTHVTYNSVIIMRPLLLHHSHVFHLQCEEENMCSTLTLMLGFVYCDHIHVLVSGGFFLHPGIIDQTNSLCRVL